MPSERNPWAPSSPGKAMVGALWAVALLWPATAHANAGLPMVIVALPLQVAALVPVVLLESWILWRSQLGLSGWQVLRVTALANAASTALGNPLAWLAIVVGQLLTAAAGTGLRTILEAVASRETADVVLRPLWLVHLMAWVNPVYLDVHWMVPAGASLIMVPYFFASWWCEFWAAQRLAPQVDRKALRSAMGRANALSYVLMIAGTTAWLAVAIAEFNDEKAACLERGEAKACAHLFEMAEYTFSDSADDLLRRLCERSHVEACTATSFRAAGDGDLAKTRLWGERACGLGQAEGCRLWAVAALRQGDSAAAAVAAARACERGRSECCTGAAACDGFGFSGL